MRWILLFLAVLATPAMAEVDQGQVSAIRALHALDAQVHNVGWRLVTGNARWCAKTAPSAGLLLHRLDDYGKRAAAAAVFGESDGWLVNAVAQGSPAAAVGILSGDQVTGQAEDKSDFLIQRGAEQLRYAITPVSACQSRFIVEPSTKFDASANGERVRITSRLVEYVASDDELAAILAHELAHNLLEHPSRLMAMDAQRGRLGSSAARIKETEIEADRLSVWLMANAGYDPTAAIQFWTRYGKEHGKGIFSGSTHYRWKKRVALFEEELAKMRDTTLVDGKWPPPLLVAFAAKSQP